jgi:hypothetical protein
MPVGLPKRLALLALLGAVFVGYIALTLNNLLDDAIPALVTLAVMWGIGVATYPRETPKGWAWVPPTLVVFMGIATLVAAGLICESAGRYAGRTDFGGLTLLGPGLVGASLVQRISLLADETATWPVFTKASPALDA